MELVKLYFDKAYSLCDVSQENNVATNNSKNEHSLIPFLKMLNDFVLFFLHFNVMFMNSKIVEIVFF